MHSFRKKYQGGAVRSVSVSYANFVDERFQILSLFDNPDDIDKEERLQSAIDSIRQNLALRPFKSNFFTGGI